MIGFLERSVNAKASLPVERVPALRADTGSAGWSSTNGHWTFVRHPPRGADGAIRRSATSAARFQPLPGGKAEVTWSSANSLGRKVGGPRGRRLRPPRLISRAESERGGDRLVARALRRGAEVWKAFGWGGRRPRGGVAPHQPSPYAAPGGRATLLSALPGRRPLIPLSWLLLSERARRPRAETVGYRSAGPGRPRQRSSPTLLRAGAPSNVVVRTSDR